MTQAGVPDHIWTGESGRESPWLVFQAGCLLS